MRRLLALLVILPLAACARPAPEAKSEPQPTATAEQTFTGCTWGEVRSDALSVWSFDCPAEHTHLVADGEGFALVSGDGVTADRRPVVRVFHKAADAPVDAVLADIRAASPGPATAACALAPVTGFDAWKGAKLYELEPTGAARASYDAANDKEPQPEPCGALGIGPVGDRYFAVPADDPSRVVWVDMGSEIQVFDPNTLKVR